VSELLTPAIIQATVNFYETTRPDIPEDIFILAAVRTCEPGYMGCKVHREVKMSMLVFWLCNAMFICTQIPTFQSNGEVIIPTDQPV
jgi:hypothetical protein